MKLSSRSEKIRQHACGAGGPAGFHGFEFGRLAKRIHHRIGDHVRRRRRELHAPSGAIAVETMGNMKILLEMVLEREVEERRSGGGQLHAGGEAALHQRQIARREMAIEIRHEGIYLDTLRRMERGWIDAGAG